jgi:hypothetical protein
MVHPAGDRALRGGPGAWDDRRSLHFVDRGVRHHRPCHDLVIFTAADHQDQVGWVPRGDSRGPVDAGVAPGIVTAQEREHVHGGEPSAAIGKGLVANQVPSGLGAACPDAPGQEESVSGKPGRMANLPRVREGMGIHRNPELGRWHGARKGVKPTGPCGEGRESTRAVDVVHMGPCVGPDTFLPIRG